MDDPRLAHHARTHRGVFTDALLRHLGISDAQARRRVRNGTWRRLHEGVYSFAGTPVSFELRAEAALAALPLAALSHLAASRTLSFGLDEEAVTVLERLDDEPPTESELEAMFWRLLERRRLQLPQRQASFDWLGDGAGRVDFWYPDHRLIVELDGRRFHLRVAAFEADRRRDQLGLMQGIATVRFSHRQVSTESPFVTTVMRSLLGA